MTEKIITCIICPVGCSIVVTGKGSSVLRMEGNQCKRGEEYAGNEFVHPMRILTTTVKLEGADSPLLPVRSDKQIPQELLMRCMAQIQNISVEAPISQYDVIVPNILGTNANIVATGEARRR